MAKRTFSAADYAVFGTMLLISALIGIFYAIKDRRSKADTDEYLMGGRSMGVLPVALSLTVSFMSAITVLGTPAEVYLYGTMYWWFVAVFLVVAILTSQIYIPTFYNLGITSTYEYLEMRFNRPVRILGTLTYLAENILYIGIVIYAPALALNEVTGLNLWLSVLTTGIVCTFYTTLGGLKAVIWTDVFQGIVMCAGFLAVIIQGSILQGGLGKVWQTCSEGGRIDFVHFETDYRIRNTFWSILCGGSLTWMGVYAVSQSQVQRYLCCRSARHATYALYLNVVGLFIVISLACLAGLVMYSYYSTCDPLEQGCVGASDQLLPYLVMDILYAYPGIPGVFVACVFSGSLSTISSGINAMATVTLEDFIKPYLELKGNTSMWVSKGLVIIYGALGIGMAVLASSLGEVLQAALSIFGIIGGPLVGLFTLGILVPFANSIGAFVGLLCGLAMSSWVYVGSKTYPPLPEFTRRLPLGQNCSVACYFQESFNTTVAPTSFSTAYSTIASEMTTALTESRPGVAELYSMSYLHFGTFGLIGTLVVGMTLSLLTGGWKNRKNIDVKLIHPFFDHWIFKWIPAKGRYYMRCCIQGRPDDEYDFQDTSKSMQTLSSYIDADGGAEKEKTIPMECYSTINYTT